MKKDNFLQGAFIATAAIVIAKVLGIIYVVPFNRAVGTLGGALYGYAYSIYTIFLSLSTAGIPFAVSKMVSEYSELGYVKAKQKALRIACFTLGILGILSFLFLIFLAPLIASFIVAGKSGGNTIEDILKSSEEDLQKADRIGPINSRKIYNVAYNAALEYISG